MSSSTHDHHFPPPPTSAPPPTPSTTTTTTTTTTTSTSISTSTSTTDLLSRLLHRLPPSLSTTTGPTPLLLRRRSSLSTSPPIITFTDLISSLSSTLPTISQLGYFQLTEHNIPSQLAHSSESDSVTLFNLSRHQKHQHFPPTWPLGFNDDDDDDVSAAHSLFLDSACSTGSSSELVISSLREFTREMERVGLAVLEALTCAVGLRNPGLDDPDAVSTLMWISDNNCGSFGDKIVGSGRFYPYVVGLHYQIRSQSCSLLTDSGLVSVLAKVDSILITLGDIAQVWSNGKLKKVRGKPALNMEEGGSDTSSLSMSLLVTLPLESTVSPQNPRAVISGNGGTDHHDNENKDVHEECSEETLFGSFSFEDYAWRVYHARDPLKDPLDRYRNKL